MVHDPYRDPEVTWGGMAVGVSGWGHMSDIAEPVAGTATRSPPSPYRCAAAGGQNSKPTPTLQSPPECSRRDGGASVDAIETPMRWRRSSGAMRKAPAWEAKGRTVPMPGDVDAAETQRAVQARASIVMMCAFCGRGLWNTATATRNDPAPGGSALDLVAPAACAGGRRWGSGARVWGEDDQFDGYVTEARDDRRIRRVACADLGDGLWKSSA